MNEKNVGYGDSYFRLELLITFTIVYNFTFQKIVIHLKT